MARRNRDTKAILKTVARSELRSTLFWWMVEHHDEFIAEAKGEKLDWRSVSARFAKQGLTDTRGRPATERNARETWAQARKKVAATRAAQAAQPPRSVYPSHMPKDWRPANAPPPEPLTTLAPVLRASTLVEPGGPANSLMPIRTNIPQEIEPYDPKKQKARLRRIIDERSGR